MTLYDRLASTFDGSRALAQARLRHETLCLLHRAQAASGLTTADIATATGDRRREVKRDFDGDGNIRAGTLARYLHAMGYEVELTLVVAGEPRRKAVEQGGHGHGCGARSEVEPRRWATPPGIEQTLGQLQTDTTPLPMPRPEPWYQSMVDGGEG